MTELKTWGWATEGAKDAFTHDQFKQVQITISIDRANTLAVLREGVEAIKVRKEVMHDHIYIVDKTAQEIKDDILTLLQETLGEK